jgi:DNA-binding MarR family transcriptional regulator
LLPLLQELLEKANIKPPQITRLAQRLEAVGFDNNIISPEKMFEQWSQLAK